MGSAAPIEVGAHGDHDLYATVAVRRQCDKGVEELRPLVLVAADGEQLLELVDREHRLAPPVGQHPAQLGQRVRAGRISACTQRWAPGSTPLRERRQQAGAQGRGLPGPRGPDDSQQGGAHQPGDQLRHEPLAAEEVVGVRGVEARRAEVRTDRPGAARRRARRGRAARARRPRAARAGRRTGRPRPRAARRARSPRARRWPPRRARPGAGPVGRGAVDVERDAARLVGERPQLGGLGALRQVELRDVGEASSPSGPSSRDSVARSASAGGGSACRTSSSSGPAAAPAAASAARSSRSAPARSASSSTRSAGRPVLLARRNAASASAGVVDAPA